MIHLSPLKCPLIFVLVASVLGTVMIVKLSTNLMIPSGSVAKNASVVTYWPKHKDKIYGLVHMAKTAGTEINGELAARFERICGNKGYSYDAYQVNKRHAEWKQNHPDKMLTVYSLPDMTTSMVEKHSRGRVHPVVQKEIGFEDCDYIAIEGSFHFWGPMVENMPDDPPFQFELHVPCRDPVDWLMSMCNYRSRNYNCNAIIKDATNECLFMMHRFLDIPLPQNVHLKCFNPIPIDPYIN
ncbi:hypothetical protein IV203_027946 [Nitzschia inconspicua]|uniref:Uncharacterized protein n=1 Tax=Nitzschia inconspicua TaxID=303405 RepID=A0A9K3LYN5_9STRA|nr:hypothetical protein IV203_027946 [Nitzschia inconspicua]